MKAPVDPDPKEVARIFGQMVREFGKGAGTLESDDVVLDAALDRYLAGIKLHVGNWVRIQDRILKCAKAMGKEAAKNSVLDPGKPTTIGKQHFLDAAKKMEQQAHLEKACEPIQTVPVIKGDLCPDPNPNP
jgi:exonuclease VII small subunit